MILTVWTNNTSRYIHPTVYCQITHTEEIDWVEVDFDATYLWTTDMVWDPYEQGWIA